MFLDEEYVNIFVEKYIFIFFFIFKSCNFTQPKWETISIQKYIECPLDEKN